MDPLGATASFITVLGTLIASTDKAYSVISGLRDAPKDVKILGEEVLQLKAVMAKVKAASELEIEFQPVSSSIQLQDSLAPHIDRAHSVLTAIEDLAKDLWKHSPSQQPSASRTGWLKKRGKIERLRNDLYRQKIDISLLLMTKTMTDLHGIGKGVHNMSGELHIMGQRLAQNDLATSSRQHEHLLLLQHILEGQTYLSCRLTKDRLPPTRPTQAYADEVQPVTSTDGDVQPLAQSSMPTLSTDLAEARSSGRSKVLPLNESAVRALGQNARKPRLGVCPCSCHSILQYSTSIITSRSFGSLVIGVTGRMVSSVWCDSQNCRDHPHFTISVAYYFPSWLVAKAIIFHCVRYPFGQPAFGLRVRNLLPEHSPAMRAIEGGQFLKLRSILEGRVSTPNDMEEMGWTLLTFAMHKNQTECCEILLDAGADEQLPDGFGNSAVDFAWLAVHENQLTPDTVDFLRHHHKRLLPYEKDGAEEYRLSPVHRKILGLETGSLEEKLKETGQPTVNATDSFGKTPLLYASRRGDYNAVKLLVENGADANIPDTMRRSPLHMAARSRSVAIIETLIGYGANPNVVNFLSESPAHYACYEEDDAKLVRPFIDAKSDINLPSKYGRTMLDIAVQSDYPELVKFLIDSGAKTEESNPTYWEMEPLGRAILCKSHGAIRALLEKRVKTDSVSTDQESILHFLARCGDPDVIQDFYSCEHVPVDPKCVDTANRQAERPADIAHSRIDTDFLQAFDEFLDCLRTTSAAEAH